MSDRVVDELNPERHFSSNDIIALLAPMGDELPVKDLSHHAKEYFYDPVLMNLIKNYSSLVTKLPFKHESLLLDRQDDKLTELEKYIAMKGFQEQLFAMRNNVTSSNVYMRPTTSSNHALPVQSNGTTTTSSNVHSPAAKNDGKVEIICIDSDSDSEFVSTKTHSNSLMPEDNVQYFEHDPGVNLSSTLNTFSQHNQFSKQLNNLNQSKLLPSLQPSDIQLINNSSMEPNLVVYNNGSHSSHINSHHPSNDQSSYSTTVTNVSSN
jgi:hypothetical protein